MVPRAFLSSARPESLSLAADFERMALRTASSTGVAREDVVLASKVYFNEGRLSKAAIEAVG